MLALLIFLLQIHDALSCMATVPGEPSACQSCPPLYDVTLCDNIDGCVAVPEKDAVIYSYGACTSATFKYTPESQLVIAGYVPFSRVDSQRAAQYSTMTCTSASKWHFEYVIGRRDIDGGILFYTTDCIPCTKETVKTTIGSMDPDICPPQVICVPGIELVSLTASTEYCTLAEFKCPAGADSIVSDAKGAFSITPLSVLADGTGRFTCKTGQMAQVGGEVAEGDLTKVSCAKKSPCAGCDLSNYVNPFCGVGGVKANVLETDDAVDPVNMCMTWKFIPVTDARVVWTFSVEGQAAPTVIMGQAAIDAIPQAVASCLNGEVYITIPSQQITNQKVTGGSMSMCLVPFP